MKHLHILLPAVVALAAAVHSVDTTRPMMTGRGNVTVVAAKTIVTHQTAPAADAASSPVQLENFVVTGSLLPHAAAPKAKR